MLCNCTETSNKTARQKMVELVQQSSLGTVFNPEVVAPEVHEELCNLYLDDYIVAVYRPSMDNEHKVNCLILVNSNQFIHDSIVC